MTCPAKHDNGELRHPWTLMDDVGLLVRVAGGEGKLVLASFGEDIVGGRKIKPVIRHFAPDKGDQMVATAEQLGQERCRNVYVMFGTVRPDLRDGLKGGEKDVVAVFGLVADFDAKDDPEAGRWRERLPMEPTMVLRTSSVPEPSYQCRYLFTKPIPMERAKRLAEKLQAACGCDAATKDVSHVWRIAGGTNWPNREKVEKHGRPAEGQRVEVEVPFSEDRLIDFDELERLLADVEVAEESREIEHAKVTFDSRFDDVVRKHVDGLDQIKAELLRDLSQVDDWDALDKSLTPEKLKLGDLAKVQAEHCVTSKNQLQIRDDGSVARIGRSRSEAMVAFAGSALRGRASVAEVCGVLANRNLAISGHVYDRKHRRPDDKLRAVVRAVAKAICTQDRSAELTTSGGLIPFSDDHLADTLLNEHGSTVRYVAELGKWFWWDGIRWLPEPTLRVFDLARLVCRAAAPLAEKRELSVANARTVAAVERLARADRRVAVTAGAFDADPMALNTPGGIIDLRTGEVGDLDPTRYMTKVTGVECAPPGKRSELWEGFLRDVTGGDEEYVAYLQRMAGYMLTGVTYEHVFFFLWGTGANGKTVFVNTIRHAAGDYATSTPVETLVVTTGASHPTDLADLKGARLVTVQETNDGQRWAESKIKAMTGGDPIKARYMRQDFFEYRPQFKLLVAGNHRPGLSSVDLAMRRRLHLLPFTVTIPTERRDKKLEAKLRAVGPVILRWMIDGCLEWQKLGLKPPEKVLAASREYLDDEDSIGRWLAECVQVTPTGKVAPADLWESWRSWCGRNNEWPGSNKRFGTKLRDRGFECVKSHGRWYLGLKLRDEERRRIEEERATREDERRLQQAALLRMGEEPAGPLVDEEVPF